MRIVSIGQGHQAQSAEHGAVHYESSIAISHTSALILHDAPLGGRGEQTQMSNFRCTGRNTAHSSITADQGSCLKSLAFVLSLFQRRIYLRLHVRPQPHHLSIYVGKVSNVTVVTVPSRVFGPAWSHRQMEGFESRSSPRCPAHDHTTRTDSANRPTTPCCCLCRLPQDGWST